MKRKLIVGLVAIAACSALIQWSSCGGGGSATPDPTVPTISSVTGISSGTTTSATIAASAATRTTGISVLTTNPLTITFSTAMDTATITTSNISLSCGGTAQTITIANSDSSTNTTFTITPSAALTQYTNCTLTIGTGVQSSDGGALAAEATYAYTTGCTVNDTFVTDTLTGGCWTPYVGNTGTQTISGGKMTLTPSGIDSANLEYKTLIPTGNITAIVSIPTFSGLTCSDGGETSNCALTLMESASQFATILAIQITQSCDGSGGLEAHVYGPGNPQLGEATILNSGSSSSDLPDTLYLKIVQMSSDTFTAFYGIGEDNYTQIGGTLTGGTVGSSLIIGLFDSNNVTDQSVSCSFADFSITGATVTGQD